MLGRIDRYCHRMLYVGLVLVLIGGYTSHEDKDNPLSQFLMMILIIKLTVNLAESHHAEDEEVDSATMTVGNIKIGDIF